MKKKLNISGMTCMHCVMSVQKALKGIDGVIEAKVDLKCNNAIAELSKEVSNEQLKAAIEDAGYEVTGIEEI